MEDEYSVQHLQNVEVLSELDSYLGNQKDMEKWFESLELVKDIYKELNETEEIDLNELSQLSIDRAQAVVFESVLENIINFMYESIDFTDYFKNMTQIAGKMALSKQHFSNDQISALRTLAQLKPDPQKGFDADSITKFIKHLCCNSMVEGKVADSAQLHAIKVAEEKTLQQKPDIEIVKDMMDEMDLVIPKIKKDKTISGYYMEDDKVVQVNFLLLDLKTLPPSLYKLDNLKKLRIDAMTGLTQLDPRIYNLQHLEYLFINKLKIRKLPEGVEKLKNLKQLYLLLNTNLESIPYAAGELKKLEVLMLDGCQKLKIPKSIFRLKYLKELSFADVRIHNLPTEIGNLKNLTYLRIPGCNITSLPDCIGNLTELTFLDLHENQISELPSTITGLTKLKGLDLGTNRIKKLPNEIEQLTSLEQLFVDKNPLLRQSRSVRNFLEVFQDMGGKLRQ